jgi:hypothetical protein
MKDPQGNPEAAILSGLRVRQDELQQRAKTLRALRELLDELIEGDESRVTELNARIRELNLGQISPDRDGL